MREGDERGGGKRAVQWGKEVESREGKQEKRVSMERGDSRKKQMANITCTVGFIDNERRCMYTLLGRVATCRIG